MIAVITVLPAVIPIVPAAAAVLASFNDPVNISNSSDIEAELKFIETEVAREMQDLHPRMNTIPDAVQSLLNEMKHQVGTLTEELTFLRQEVKQKNIDEQESITTRYRH